MAVLNGLRLARDYGVPLRIYWPKLGEPGVSIGDVGSLFSDDFMARHFIGVQEVQALRAAAVEVSAAADLADGKSLSESLEGGAVYLMDTLGEIEFRLPWEEHETIRSGLSTVLREEDLAPSLVLLMTQIRQRLSEGSAESTAYHVRHGDLTEFLRTRNRPWPTKFVPTEIYIAHMDAARKNAGARQFLVFGDNIKSLERIRRERPDCIFFRDLVDLSALRPIQIDFLELYAMSLCPAIVAPASSGFSRVAAIVGGCAISDVIADLPDAILAPAMDELCERLAAGPSKFLTHGEAGQCMVHADSYLVRTGQGLRSGKIMSRLIQDGVNISFLYPMAMARLISAGEDGEARLVAEVAQNRCIEERGDLCEVLAQRASVSLRLGEPQIAARSACVSFYAGQNSRSQQEAVADLIFAGILSSTNFPPFDPSLQHLLDGKSKPRAVDSAPSGPNARRVDKIILSMTCDWSAFIHKQSARNLTPRLISSLLDRSGVALERLISEEERAHLTSFQSRLLVFHGRQKEAVDLGLSAVAICPENALFHFRLATAYEASADLPAALDSAITARSLDSVAATYSAYEAQLCVRLGKRAEARTAYLSACSLDPGLPLIGFEATKFFKRLKEWEHAETCIESSLSCIPRDPYLLTMKGEILRSAGRHDEALEIFRTLQEEGEELRSFGSQIGTIMFESGQTANGISYLATAVEENQGSAALRIALAKLQRRSGDYTGALTTLDPSSVKPGDRAAITVERGLVFEELGQPESAISCATEAAELAPGNAWYARHLDRVRKLIGAQ